MAQTMNSQWTYPLEETNANVRRPQKRSEPYGAQDRWHTAPKPVRQTPQDPYSVMSDSEEVKQRRVSLRANIPSTSRKRSRNTLRDYAQDMDRADDSAWIHRDKLAEIEIQEMEAAGIYMPPSRRSMSQGPGASRRSSRSASRSRAPRGDESPPDPVPEALPTAAYLDYVDKPLPRPPRASTGGGFDPVMDTEFRTPEEIAAEQSTTKPYLTRPSTSRIPISKTSPVPVPSNVIGRDSPLPRSRAGSSAGSGNWEDMQYARRARSSSIGSLVIMDEDSPHTPPLLSSNGNKLPSAEGSPPKARVPTRTTPRSAGRKGSLPLSADRPGSSYGKTREGSGTVQRPASRSGISQIPTRPSTSHRAPEGDPPWIDSMYKPDPRLPPDQQMLPTHAKRMMQEQWEKEGNAGGTVYDRNLNPLNDREFPPPKSKPPPLDFSAAGKPLDRTGSPAKQVDGPNTPGSGNLTTWPQSPKSDDAPLPSPRPGTSGGFRLTPKITTPPPIERSPISPPNAATQTQTMSPRMPELDEKQEAEMKKGKCGCCIVM